MPEITEEKSEAKKAGYNNIAEISRTRIKKVVEKLQKEREGKLDLEAGSKQLLGFKSYKIVPSNFNIWRNDVAGKEALLAQLEIFTQAEKDGSLHENMLHELILKAGLPLTTSITKADDGKGNTAFYIVDDGKLIICFEQYSKSAGDAVIAVKPQKVIMLNSSFEKDEDLTNFKLQLKDAGIELTII